MDQSRSPTKYAATCFNGKHGLVELEAQWRLLERTVAGLTHHHTFAWYEAAVHSGLMDEKRVVFVGIADGGRLVAVLPLEIGNPDAYWLRIRIVGFAHNSHLILRDMVVDASTDRPALLEFVFGWLRRQTEFRWDLVQLEQVPGDSIFRAVPNSTGTVRHLAEVQGASAIIACSGTHEQNLAHLPGKFRRNLGRLERKAWKLGSVELVTCSRGNGNALGVDEFITIENASWKGDSGTSIASDRNLVEFYTRLMQAEFGSIDCRINLLRIGDEFVAGQFGFLAGDAFRILKIGYRRDYADVSPGTLLLAYAIREFSENEQVKRIDLVTAPEWSRVWRTELLPVYRITIFNRTVQGVSAFAKRQLRKSVGKLVARRAARNMQTPGMVEDAHGTVQGRSS